jgi:hypothetical protein
MPIKQSKDRFGSKMLGPMCDNPHHINLLRDYFRKYNY